MNGSCNVSVLARRIEPVLWWEAKLFEDLICAGLVFHVRIMNLSDIFVLQWGVHQSTK